MLRRAIASDPRHSGPARRRRSIAPALAALAVAASPPAARGAPRIEIFWEEAAPGVRYAMARIPKGPVIAHVIEADLSRKDLAVRCLKARGEETLEAICARGAGEGETILAAINGDYFYRGVRPRGIPWGLAVSRGELLFPPSGKSALFTDSRGRPRVGVLRLRCEYALGVARAARWLPVEGVNLYGSRTATAGTWIYTPRYDAETPRGPEGVEVAIGSLQKPLRVGETTYGRVVSVARTKGGTRIPEDGLVLVFRGVRAGFRFPAAPGAIVRFRASLPPARGAVGEAIGGGPRILRAGRVSVEFSREAFSVRDRLYLEKQRHPRAAVGVDRSGRRLYLVAVEGRSKTSVGMSMRELAGFLARLGVAEALAMDGGGSVGLFVAGYKAALGRTPGGTLEERMLANALAVVGPKEGAAKGGEGAPKGGRGAP